MVRKPRLICWTASTRTDRPPGSPGSWERVERPEEVLEAIAAGTVQGVYVPEADVPRFEQALRQQAILDHLPHGVALLDADESVLWCNAQFKQWADQAQGEPATLPARSIPPPGPTPRFFEMFAEPELIGPDFSPFSSALLTGEMATSMLRTRSGLYLKLRAIPLRSADPAPRLVATLSDHTTEWIRTERLKAIHDAGAELADLTPEDVFHMELEDRIELLKSNIIQQTQELLQFDVIEIRLLDQETAELKPLLSVGIDSDASDRPLYARINDNGVTGFVAATGFSYLCEDTRTDPLYIEGFRNARSSMTVPLKWHNQVIGTFNVESPHLRAFDDEDLHFLEVYSNEIVMALNTLELLVAQKAGAALQSVEAIHQAVALPVDEILNDAVNVLEGATDLGPDMSERLRRILQNARDIKCVIQKVGRRLTPAEAVPAGTPASEGRGKLEGLRILVVDEDEEIRNDAHAKLERYGCIVETAHCGREAIGMVRSCLPEMPYDVIISAIRLPDMTGYDLMCQLQPLQDPLPLALMAGFGYDPAHVIVKARKAGLSSKALLYKPFRLDQLLETVEWIGQRQRAAQAAGS